MFPNIDTNLDDKLADREKYSERSIGPIMTNFLGCHIHYKASTVRMIQQIVARLKSGRLNIKYWNHFKGYLK